MPKGISATRHKYNGNANPKWRGGRIKMSDGRVLLYMPSHPKANCMGGTYILEYRLIAEQITGRHLFDSEIVHHKNGDVTDNRLENLEVLTQSDHVKKHFSGTKSPNHKLSKEQIIEIRECKESLPKLSRKFGVAISTIHRARQNKTYKGI